MLPGLSTLNPCSTRPNLPSETLNLKLKHLSLLYKIAVFQNYLWSHSLVLWFSLLTILINTTQLLAASQILGRFLYRVLFFLIEFDIFDEYLELLGKVGLVWLFLVIIHMQIKIHSVFVNTVKKDEIAQFDRSRLLTQNLKLLCENVCM